MLGHTTRQIRVGWAVLACSLALAAAACGGGDSTETTTRANLAPTTAPGGAGAGTAAPTGDFEPQSFTVDHTVWHSGFKIDVRGGELSRDENALSGRVTHSLVLEVSYENLGPFDTFFDAQMAVVADGDSFVYENFGGDSVGSGLSSKAELTFRVEEGFDPSGAQLIIGSGDEARATVPLGPGGGELVALEPIDVAVSGSISMELIDLEVTGGELRHDVPKSYRQVDSGELALTLRFDATNRKSGNWSIFADNFALVGPDGNAIGADGAELENLAGSDSGTVTSDMTIRFLVSDPPSGEYSLRFTPGNWFIGEDGATEATLDFTLD